MVPPWRGDSAWATEGERLRGADPRRLVDDAEPVAALDPSEPVLLNQAAEERLRVIENPQILRASSRSLAKRRESSPKS